MDGDRGQPKRIKLRHREPTAEPPKPEIPDLIDIKHGKESLGQILSRISEFVYQDLFSLADVIPGLDRIRQKEELKAHSKRVKSALTKALVLVRFSQEHGDHLQTLRNLYAFLSGQQELFDTCANALLDVQRAMHRNFRCAFDVSTAVDVLSNGKLTQLPQRLKDLMIPPSMILSAERLQYVKKKLSQQIMYRLAIYDFIPAAFRLFDPTVGDGWVKIHIPQLYTVYLTVSSLLKSANWRILVLKWSKSLSLAPLPAQAQNIVAVANTALSSQAHTNPRLRLPDRALMRLHDTLHTIVTQLFLCQWYTDILEHHKQILRVRWTKPNSFAQFAINFWHQRPFASTLHGFFSKDSRMGKSQRPQEEGFYLLVKASLPHDHFQYTASNDALDRSRSEQRVHYEQQYSLKGRARIELFSFEAFAVSRAGDSCKVSLLKNFDSSLVLSKESDECIKNVWLTYLDSAKQLLAAGAMNALFQQCQTWLQSCADEDIMAEMAEGRILLTRNGVTMLTISFCHLSGRFQVSGDPTILDVSEQLAFEDRVNVDVELALSSLLDMSVKAEWKRMQAVVGALPKLVLRTDIPLKSVGQQRLLRAHPALSENSNAVTWAFTLFYQVLGDSPLGNGGYIPTVAILLSRSSEKSCIQTWIWNVIITDDADLLVPNIVSALPIYPTTGGKPYWTSVSIAELTQLSSAVDRYARALPWIQSALNNKESPLNTRLFFVVENLPKVPSLALKPTSYASLWPSEGLKSPLTLLQRFPVTTFCVEAPAFVREFAGRYLRSENLFLFYKSKGCDGRPCVFSKLHSCFEGSNFWQLSYSLNAIEDTFMSFIRTVYLQCFLAAMRAHKTLLAEFAPQLTLTPSLPKTYTENPLLELCDRQAGYILELTLRCSFGIDKQAKLSVSIRVRFSHEAYKEHELLYTTILQSLLDNFEQISDEKFFERFTPLLLSVVSYWSTVWPLHAAVHDLVYRRRKQLFAIRPRLLVPAASVQSLSELQLFYYPLLCGVSICLFTDAVVLPRAREPPLTFVTCVNKVYCADMADNPTLKTAGYGAGTAGTLHTTETPARVPGGFNVKELLKSQVKFHQLDSGFASTWSELDQQSLQRNLKTTTFSTGRVVSPILFCETLQTVEQALYSRASSATFPTM